MKKEDFLIERDTFEWGTYGKNGDEPLKYIILKDICDEHLDNIIIFIKRSNNGIPDFYNLETISLMEQEKEYRLKSYRKQKLENLNEKYRRYKE
jgi:hypothetical protein